MRVLPIISKPDVRGALASAEAFAGPLPAFYMNDYSVMGLRVNDCAAAFRLLEAHRYAVIHRQGCRGVAIRSAREVRQIIDLLARNGVNGEVMDIAGHMYQG